MTKGKAPANNNFYDRYFYTNDPHRTLVDQIDAGKYIIGRARANARETDFLWQIWTLDIIGTQPQITYASDGEPRFRWVDRELVTDPNLPDDGSPGGIFIADPQVDAGSPAGTLVGFLFPKAKDVGIETYSFAITADPSNKFALDPLENNKLLLSDTANGVDDEYQLEVLVIDSQGRFATEWITVDVVNIRLTDTRVAETAPLGTKIADIIAVGDTPPTSFSITSDPDNKFDIIGSDLITNDAFDFSVSESHQVTIEYTDALLQQQSETFTIEVDADESSLLEAVTTEDLHGDSAVRVILAEQKIINIYNEVLSTGVGDSIIISHTVPAGKFNHLMLLQASGENVADYTVEVNGLVVSKTRTYYTNYNVEPMDLGELQLEEGDLVEVIANNRDSSAAFFNATLKYKEHDL